MAITGLFKGKQLDADTITSREASTAQAVGIDGDTTNQEGGATALARANHTHSLLTGAPSAASNPNDSLAEGSAAGMARADHAHSFTMGNPVSVGTAIGGGTANSFARSDHIHDLATGAKNAVLASKIMAAVFSVSSLAVAAAGFVEDNATTKAIMDASSTKQIGGDGSTSGLVTSASWNRVQVRDSSSNDPYQTAAGEEVYARLTPTQSTPSGTWTWDGTTTVLSNDTSGVSVGDWIAQASGGPYFEITGITPNTSVTITNPGSVTIPTGSGVDRLLLRVTWYYEANGGSETGYTFSGTDTADLLVPETAGLDQLGWQALLRGLDFQEPLASDHTHDSRYFTETELGDVGSGNPNTTSGAALIGTDASAIGGDAGSTDTVQGVLEAFQSAIDTLQTAELTPAQESVTTEVITGTDTALGDTLNSVPQSNAAVALFFNGAFCPQGAGAYYTLSSQTITWLASTGTAPDMTADDQLIAVYHS